MTDEKKPVAPALAREAMRNLWAHLWMLHRFGFAEKDCKAGYVESEQGFGIIVSQGTSVFKFIIEPAVELTDEEEKAYQNSFYEELTKLSAEGVMEFLDQSGIVDTAESLAVAMTDAGLRIPSDEVRGLAEERIKERDANAN